jgi:LmbE family N-acetylglucosaminyl deacetylase
MTGRAADRHQHGQAGGVATYLSLSEEVPRGPLPAPQRALAIGAHPDDIELGAGATLARWARSGTALTLLVATDGRAGTWSPTEDPAELAARRAREASAAAGILGAGLRLLGIPDGHLHDAPLLAWRLALAIRAVRPEVVLVHDPVHASRIHPDHRALGEHALEAIVLAREPALWHWLAPAHRPRLVALYETPAPTHAEPIAPADLTTKVRLLACHESQYATSYGVGEEDDPIAVLSERVLTRATRDGALFAVEGPAELFRLLPDV